MFDVRLRASRMLLPTHGSSYFRDTTVVVVGILLLCGVPKHDEICEHRTIGARLQSSTPLSELHTSSVTQAACAQSYSPADTSDRRRAHAASGHRPAMLQSRRAPYSSTAIFPPPFTCLVFSVMQQLKSPPFRITAH